MVAIFKKIDNKERPQFTMPLSLRLIKECASAGIDWKCLHIADLLSIIYSIRMDNAKRYLEEQRQKKMQNKGIKEIRKANADDFDKL